MKRSFSLTLFFIFIFGFATSVQSIDIYVDITTGTDTSTGYFWTEAKRTISAGLGLSMSMPGPDTVHVAEGDYTGGIILVSETTLLGGYPTGGGSRNPSIYITRIIGGTPVVTGANNAVIDGFTITGGTGVTNYPTITDCWAGGIMCDGTSPTISNNVITGNHLVSLIDLDKLFPGVAMGAGIYCKSSLAVITGNRIENNSVAGVLGACWPCYAKGGGIYCRDSSLTITNNIIKLNSATGGETVAMPCNGGEGEGAGIYCLDSSCTISNNVIENNTATGGRGYSSGGAGMGAGIRVENGMTLISGNRIMKNIAHGGFSPRDNYFAQGGGICAIGADTIIQNNLIGFNETGKMDYTEAGGGIYTDGKVVNNTIFNNVAHDGGGIKALKDAEIINNIFINNDNFAVVEDFTGPPTAIQNNNFYNNSSGILKRYPITVYSDVTTMDAELMYSMNNISCPPDFVGTDDYHLQSISCCIDAGTSYLAPSTDFDLDPRPQGAGYDIGADEYTAGPAVPTADIQFRVAMIFLVSFCGIWALSWISD